jgi:biopolymer transport protein ExbD
MQLDSGKTTAAINMTPMIDILLVLLIICMVIQNRTEGLPAEVPEPAPADAKPIVDRRDCVLKIRSDHSMEIDSKPVQPLELASSLTSLFAVRPDGVLFIDGARELDFVDVATAIDIARGAGVARIGIITVREGDREGER